MIQAQCEQKFANENRAIHVSPGSLEEELVVPLVQSVFSQNPAHPSCCPKTKTQLPLG